MWRTGKAQLNSFVPLTPIQVTILKDPRVRARLPQKADDFAYADAYLASQGIDCPRLPVVWTRIFIGIDIPTATWLNATFKGHSFVGTAVPTSKVQPPLKAPVAPNNNHAAVRNALRAIQSFRKFT